LLHGVYPDSNDGLAVTASYFGRACPGLIEGLRVTAFRFRLFGREKVCSNDLKSINEPD